MECWAVIFGIFLGKRYHSISGKADYVYVWFGEIYGVSGFSGKILEHPLIVCYIISRTRICVESQSTFTYNIIIRALMYLVQTYHEYFKRTNQNLYGSRKAAVPKPEIYMIFTGEKKNIPDIISLREDFFGGEKISLDVEVKVLYQENEKDIIGQYIIFCKVYSEQRKIHGNTELAVTETIRICKDKNVLREYLISKEQEVVDIMMTLFDDEQIMEAYEQDIRNSEARETAERLIKKGKMSLEEIADCVPALSLDELREIEAAVMQLS